MVAKRKCRKANGRWGQSLTVVSGSGIESRESRRQRIMAEREEKTRRKAESDEIKRQQKIKKLKGEAEYSEALAKKRKAQSQARQYHPLRRALSKIKSPTTKTKRGKIRWF
jgi:regulator of protease activity HflC (stomatin/prohibitin superfamily)